LKKKPLNFFSGFLYVAKCRDYTFLMVSSILKIDLFGFCGNCIQQDGQTKTQLFSDILIMRINTQFPASERH